MQRRVSVELGGNIHWGSFGFLASKCGQGSEQIIMQRLSVKCTISDELSGGQTKGVEEAEEVVLISCLSFHSPDGLYHAMADCHLTK